MIHNTSHEWFCSSLIEIFLYAFLFLAITMCERVKCSPCPSTIKLLFRESSWLRAHVPTVGSSLHIYLLICTFSEGLNVNFFFFFLEKKERGGFLVSCFLLIYPSVYPFSSLFTHSVLRIKVFLQNSVSLPQLLFISSLFYFGVA